jgi:hypothetical protein
MLVAANLFHLSLMFGSLHLEWSRKGRQHLQLSVTNAPAYNVNRNRGKFYSSCPGEGKEVNLLLLSLKVFKAKAFWN